MHTKAEDHGRIAVRLVPVRRACTGIAALCFTLAFALCAVASEPSDTIDLRTGWKFHLDPGARGEVSGWAAPRFDDSAWPSLEAGKRWEEQGYPDADGSAWYRRAVDIPSAWRGSRVWIAFGGVNDACVVYCNGRRVHAYGDRVDYSVALTPLTVDLTAYLRVGERNQIAVQVMDWGGSGGLWRTPCLLTRDPAIASAAPAVAWYTEDEAKSLAVEIDCRSLGNDRGAATAQIALKPRGGDVMSGPRLDVSQGVTFAAAHFPLPASALGMTCELTVQVADAKGKPMSGSGAPVTITLPERPAWPAKYGALRILNNFVTELAGARLAPGASRVAFQNPRSGWVFIAIEPTGPGPAPTVYLDDETECLVWRTNPDTRAVEAMRQLVEGAHTLRVKEAGSAALTVRAVPELAYCYYLANPHIGEQGPYDKAFLSRYVLSHVNTLVSSAEPPADDFARWRQEGRQWLANATLPGIGSATAPRAEAVYQEWAANPGVRRTGYGGLIVDEFINAGADHYRAWTQAVTQLIGDTRFAGRTFYAWCGELYQTPPGLEFARALLERDERFVWEVYLSEDATEQGAQRSVRRSLQHSLRTWEAAAPGTRDHMELCLGYMSAPPESLNTNPGVDYNVFMDMQLHLLATEPEFWKLYGLMEYSASYADEEAVRWAHRLFRHYCIEGRRERLIAAPYELPHLKNPDFAHGTASWTVEPASPGSVLVQTMDAFSWLQGRYPKTTRGDQYLRFTRSGQRPNRVTQTLTALRPGQVYSVKLLSADMRRMEVKSSLGLSVEIHGGETLREHSFQAVYPSNYAHEAPPFTKDRPAWLNYHRVVFRATGPTAELVISDWSNGAPAGPAGQEIGFNFVEAQPYLLP